MRPRFVSRQQRPAGGRETAISLAGEYIVQARDVPEKLLRGLAHTDAAAQDCDERRVFLFQDAAKGKARVSLLRHDGEADDFGISGKDTVSLRLQKGGNLHRKLPQHRTQGLDQALRKGLAQCGLSEIVFLIRKLPLHVLKQLIHADGGPEVRIGREGNLPAAVRDQGQGIADIAISLISKLPHKAVACVFHAAGHAVLRHAPLQQGEGKAWREGGVRHLDENYF